MLWASIGYAIASRLVPRSLALPIAPAMGWAIHSVVMLPIYSFTGMSKAVVAAAIVMPIVAALAVSYTRPPPAAADAGSTHLPIWAFVAAGLLAFAVMAAIIPHVASDGATLADPIFDHAKIAMIDEMARLGVPPDNPFFGEAGGVTRLAYYYLWHFSAAELAVLTGLGGWNADAAMTWFTAFSSLTLMMGFACWFSSRASSAAWVIVLAVSSSIRPIIVLVFGSQYAHAVTGWPTGFGAWLFQVTWAPQHVASASCAVIAIFLLAGLARRQHALLVVTFGLIAAAAFQSSTWVGGVTFPLAAALAGGVILLKMTPDKRRAFIACVAIAAAIAVLFSSPFIYDQLRAATIRSDGAPIAIMPYDVLGDEFSEKIRLFFDLPAYWLIFLFVEFAAFYPAGVVMLFLLANDRLLSEDRKRAASALGLLTIVSLGVGGLLVSTIGANNDLAWRGVLPAIDVLIIATAAGLSRFLGTLRPLYSATAVALVALAFLEGVRSIYGNIDIEPNQQARRFADSELMWKAVRRHSNAADRVANNPLFLSGMTQWPINISWALLADRSSCYAGSDLALPFAPLTRARRKDIDAQFMRVFSGAATPADIRELATTYNCAVVVITTEDGAWKRDPFAQSSFYRMAEEAPDTWRLYKVQHGGK